jgi:glycosyltransferase involved in cell wall biosynthesis
MAVRDRESCVARAIGSVLAQTYPAVELIVVDDGSTDGTRAVVASFGDRLRLVAQPAAGPYAARDRGVAEARGDLIALIDSDDAWRPERLAAQVPLMSRPEVGLVFGDAVHVAAPRDDAPRTGHSSFALAPPRRGRVAGRFAWCNFVPTSTVLVRRACLEEIGGFGGAPLSADYLAWFRISLRHELDYVDAPLADYTVHGEGISFDLGRSLAARIDLFSAELERTADPIARRLIRRLLFNLSLHLALAVPRGRAKSVPAPLALAWRTAGRAAGRKTAPWVAAFAANQLRMRARRLLP